MIHGTQDDIALDLEQLYRRLDFNIFCGNREDHLRNHGFLWGEDGWQPAIDNSHLYNADGKVSFVLSGALKPAEGPPAAPAA